MFKKWRSYVSLLVCSFCILSMLFLDTLRVSAFSINDILNQEVCTTGDDFVQYFRTNNMYGDYSRPDSNVTNTWIGISYKTNFPMPVGEVSSLNLNEFYYIDIELGDISVLWDFYYRANSSSPLNHWSDMPALGAPTNGVQSTDRSIYAHVVNPRLIDSSGAVVSQFFDSSSGNYHYVCFLRGKDLLNGDSSSSFNCVVPLTLQFELNSTNKPISYSVSYSPAPSFVLVPKYKISVYSLKGKYKDDIGGLSVNDNGSQIQLNELNDTQSSIKNTTEDTNFKITDFFGNFFTNLIGVFVPEDGFFSDWFERLNTLLSEKLGMLYAPFDLLISTLQSIYSADSSSAGIPFPGIQWGDTWLIEPFTFTFDSLGSDFSDLRDKVYFGTDTVLIFTFLILLQKKVRLILEGHE